MAELYRFGQVKYHASAAVAFLAGILINFLRMVTGLAVSIKNLRMDALTFGCLHPDR